MQRALCLLFGGFCFVGGFSLQAAEFYRIPDLGDGQGVVISDDGMVAVGEAGNEMFLWSRKSGTRRLRISTEEMSFRPKGISRDGSVVVGLWATSEFVRPARWSSKEGLSELGLAEGRRVGELTVSADGQVVVGTSGPAVHVEPKVRISPDGKAIVDRPPSDRRVFRWTKRSGLQEIPDMPPEAYAIRLSADGLVVLGNTPVSDGLPGRAFTWTEKDGTKMLPQLPTENSHASAINDDGSIAFGVMLGGRKEVARWVRHAAPETLGNLKGEGLITTPTATTSDGRTFVGSSRPSPGSTADSTATIWNARDGFRSIREVLVMDYKLGESLQGWVLRSASISGDGSVIVGDGENPPGKPAHWVAILK